VYLFLYTAGLTTAVSLVFVQLTTSGNVATYPAKFYRSSNAKDDKEDAYPKPYAVGEKVVVRDSYYVQEGSILEYNKWLCKYKVRLTNGKIIEAEDVDLAPVDSPKNPDNAPDILYDKKKKIKEDEDEGEFEVYVKKNDDEDEDKETGAKYKAGDELTIDGDKLKITGATSGGYMAYSDKKQKEVFISTDKIS